MDKYMGLKFKGPRHFWWLMSSQTCLGEIDTEVKIREPTEVVGRLQDLHSTLAQQDTPTAAAVRLLQQHLGGTGDSGDWCEEAYTVCPKHSMGTAIYAAPLTPQTTPTDRQSYGSPMVCLGVVKGEG